MKEHWLQKQVLWRWHHQYAWVSGRQNFHGFCGKGFPADSRYFNGNQLCPSSSRHISLLYEAEFIQSLLSTGRKQLASRFNFTYRYINDVLSINNPELENYLGQIHPVELDIKDTTESTSSASYLDLLLSIGRDGQLQTSIYDKRDDFNLHITNFPFLSSNIPASPYGVFISQLIWYARACFSYECFILRATRLSNKLLEQGYVKERLKSSFKKFFLVDTGILSNNTKFLSHECLLTFCSLTKFNDSPPPMRLYTNLWPSTDLWEVSIEHVRRV